MTESEVAAQGAAARAAAQAAARRAQSPVSTAPQRPPRIPKNPPPIVVESPRIRALEKAIAYADPAGTPEGDEERASITADFWEQVAGMGTPLVEAPWPNQPEARAVTFVWRDRHGTEPGTRVVVLLANKVTDPSVWAESVLHHIEGTDVWHRTYLLPSDWQGTYQLAPDDGPIPAAAADAPQHGPRSRWAGVATTAVSDPYAPLQLAGKPGELPSSVARLDQAPPQPWRDRRRLVRRGSLQETLVPSHILGAPRRVWTYVPSPTAVPTGADHDLLILLDGEDWARRLDLVSTLDNLLADGRTRPTVAVLVDAIDTPTRWRELTCNPAFTSFLTDELLTWARRTLPVTTDAARTAISGRSLGGLTALYAGLRAPDRFGAVHAQSTSLWWPAEPIGDREPGWLVRQLAAAPALPARISLEVGRQEWMLLGPGRDLARTLEARGDVDVRFAEYEGGHDAWCWRGGLAEALAAFGPGPEPESAGPAA